MNDTIYCGVISIRLPLKTGTMLKGQYEIVTSLGSGGFGITYLALDRAHDNYKVAIKELFPKIVSGKESYCIFRRFRKSFDRISEFIDEAKLMTSVHDERIVRVLDYFKENGTAYYVMEFIDGETLRKFIKKHGPMNSKMAVQLIKEVALGLKAIHDKGILHGDLKPSNIMLNAGKVKIMDFGAASFKNTIYVTTRGKIISWFYSAPERFCNSTIITPQSDIYSLGGILFFIVSGEDPISAPK